VDSFDFKQVKLVFFAASPAVSRSFAPKAQQAGCTVIDLSGVLDGAVALVPEANAKRIADLPQPALITSPAQARWHWPWRWRPQGLLDIERVQVNACRFGPGQGSGQRAGPANRAAQCARWSRASSTARWPSTCCRRSAHPTSRAIPPWSAAWSANALLGLPELKISVSCVQVPVFFGDSFSVAVQSRRPVDLERSTALEAPKASSWWSR
jgi:hypothetical protein